MRIWCEDSLDYFRFHIAATVHFGYAISRTLDYLENLSLQVPECYSLKIVLFGSLVYFAKFTK